jgi:transposase-like protein
MSPKKLSDEEKTELIRLYRQTDATTATLAEHFQVSSSTISRVLRNNLSSEEYENLIQRKRYNRQKKQSSSSDMTTEITPSESEKKTTSSQAESSVSSFQPETKPGTISEVDSESSSSEQPVEPSRSSQEISISPEQDEQEFLEQIDFSVIQAMFGEDVGEDDDLEDSEEEDWDEEEETVQTQRKREDEVEVLPLSQAKFPRTCYLVIDRGANLITKPLKEFSDLGKIPSVETQQKTLPIFENHRVARRFSNRSQKVIKIPDGKMIKKTREHLEAKGIKRILMDGKVYTLS